MAEAAVGLLIVKLGTTLATEVATFGASLLWKEASALKCVFRKIHEAKVELESMQAYLQEAERFKDTDKTTGIFVKEIRGFAFQIEDAVDEFTYKLQEEKHGGFVAKMKKRLKHIKTWRRLAVKLQKIRDKLQEAKQRKKDYAAITEMDRSATGGGAPNAKSTNQALHFTRDEDLVGIEENKGKLVQWLTGDLEKRSQITTVWGMPGVGKTTLVAHVYNTVKVDFDTAAWVTVSESYHLEDLLKKITTEFGIAVDMANMEMRSLAQIIHDYLQGKKYILVLDDVWIVRMWSEIRNIFPTNSVGRFVITSRKHEVSLLATRESAIHLEPLGAHHSWVLFCKGAFWNDDDNDKECPLELQNLAWKFVGKCQGLPIAIACIGRLLSCKPPTSAEWENVYMALELQLAEDVIPDVDMILKVSLEDLSYDLKNCFLHCALFPEGYVIKRWTIMRHWIAAGFIREKENKTLEEVANGYLTELVNRSLLQLVKRNYSRGSEHYRVHDVIRLLALNKANEECFGKVYNGSMAFSVEGTRRISIQSENLEQLSRSRATHLHALHVFERYIDIDLLRPILTSSNFLSTLDLQGARIKVLPKEVFNLFNLHYLGLRDTHIESLPEALGRLENLQVLDASGTQLSYLPNNVVRLRKLRYLYADTRSALEIVSGVKVPNGIMHLTGLRALRCVKASPEILREVGALTELRTFSVCNVRSVHSADLSNAIAKMNHLAHLEIVAATENEVLRLQGLYLPPTLSWLALLGQLEKISMPQLFSSWSHLNSLTQLCLAFSKLDEDCFSCLWVLHGLCSLVLMKAFEGKKLDFCAGSFPKLRYICIHDAAQLNQVEIEEGSMQNLVELFFIDCPELKFLPCGIQHLTALEKLHLQETSEELIEKLRQKRDSDECNEDVMKISNIRNVTVVLKQKGVWARVR